jgi:hypothetical protein
MGSPQLKISEGKFLQQKRVTRAFLFAAVDSQSYTGIVTSLQSASIILCLPAHQTVLLKEEVCDSTLFFL